MVGVIIGNDAPEPIHTCVMPAKAVNWDVFKCECGKRWQLRPVDSFGEKLTWALTHGGNVPDSLWYEYHGTMGEERPRPPKGPSGASQP